MLEVINPYNNKVLKKIKLHSQKDANKMIKQAQKAQPKLAELSSGERYEILTSIVDGIKDRYEEFVNTLIAESGKPYIYSKGEVDRGIQTFQCAAEEAKRFPHELIDLDWTEKGRGKKGEVHYVPAGIVFGISPFNFPLNLVAHKVAPAIASGCPIILKPSSKTPLTTLLLAEVIAKTKLPKHAFQVLICEREVGNKLIEDDKIDVLSFTGSPGVGWEMKANAGKKKVVLELGGNAAAIICEDADYDTALSESLTGGFAYSGQVCIHTQRIYVHESIFDKFVKDFSKSVKQIKSENPKNKKTRFGVMIDEKNAKRVEDWVEEAKEKGAIILAGGKRKGAVYPATLITNSKKGMKVRDEEVFGPVVIIESFKKMSDAIDEVNDCRWGLQTAIYTDSTKRVDEAFKNLKVGALIHNAPTIFRIDHMPYGGIKDSGFGREGVRYAMMDYLEAKLLVK